MNTKRIFTDELLQKLAEAIPGAIIRKGPHWTVVEAEPYADDPFSLSYNGECSRSSMYFLEEIITDWVGALPATRKYVRTLEFGGEFTRSIFLASHKGPIYSDGMYSTGGTELSTLIDMVIYVSKQKKLESSVFSQVSS